MAAGRTDGSPGISPVTEWRFFGCLAAAGVGAEPAVSREQFRSSVSGTVHVRFEKGGTAGSPSRDIIGRELDDLHALLHGKRVRFSLGRRKALPHATLRVLCQLVQDFLIFGCEALPRFLVDGDHK